MFSYLLSTSCVTAAAQGQSMEILHALKLKAPCGFIAELSRLVLLVKLMETSERWEEGDHTRPLPAHICSFSV